jgi:hypothetical protein
MHNLQSNQKILNNRIKAMKISSWNTFSWDCNKVKKANRVSKIWEFQTLKLILKVENRVEILLLEYRLQGILEILLMLKISSFKMLKVNKKN